MPAMVRLVLQRRTPADAGADPAAGAGVAGRRARADPALSGR
jgi:hypothetical protein